MIAKQEMIGKVITSIPEAQLLIGRMISEESENIAPCSGCIYVSEKG